MAYGMAFVALTPGSAPQTPAIVGMGAQLLFGSFLVIILVVPWLMTRPHGAKNQPGVEGPATTGSSTASLFSSPRERRLWTWTIWVLIAIYATLSPAQQVAASLRERNLLGLSTTVGFLVVGGVVAVFWLRTEPGRREMGAALGILAVYLATLIRMPVPEGRSHLFEYGLVGILIYQALLERRRNGRRTPAPALQAAAATGLLGWVDEGIQAVLPNRVYDLRDVGLNVAFGLMAILATAFLGWARRWDSRRRGG
jgi:VanZ family protein